MQYDIIDPAVNPNYLSKIFQMISANMIQCLASIEGSLHLHQISGDQIFSSQLLPTTFSQHEGAVRLQPADGGSFNQKTLRIGYRVKHSLNIVFFYGRTKNRTRE